MVLKFDIETHYKLACSHISVGGKYLHLANMYLTHSIKFKVHRQYIGTIIFVLLQTIYSYTLLDVSIFNTVNKVKTTSSFYWQNNHCSLTNDL